MLLKGMPSLFIIISSIESIAKKKLKKKTVLPRRVIPSPGIEAYNDSARACAAFECACHGKTIQHTRPPSLKSDLFFALDGLDF